MTVLDSIPFEFDFDTFSTQIHLSRYPEAADRVQKMLELALPLIKPKALYRMTYIEERGKDTIGTGGITFTSRILRDNLESVERFFPYVATCGNELENLTLPTDDYMTSYWLDCLKETALRTARDFLLQSIQKEFFIDRIASMNPGSGNASVWPIRQQRELFALLGDVEQRIGVILKPSYLMVPNKSVSGVFFATEVGFESCQVCTREDCPRRRAPYQDRGWS